MSPDGQVRPAWEPLLATLNSLGESKMRRRWERVRRMLTDHGVTFSLDGDQAGVERPWELDPIPFILSEKEWTQIEDGAVQRARLLKALLEDLYHERIMLAQRWVPPELVFASPGFLRPCAELTVNNDSRPFLLTLDLGRGPDGQWQVIRQNCRSARGAGYALENRLLIARMLPEFFQTSQVRRLLPFFESLRSGLVSFSVNQDEPRVVLWSEGSSADSAFEQAYLAQSLGIPLVESADLTVRDNRVYLKLLDGLQPVHVLFRWIRDVDCDPLELPGASLGGVAGLVQAIRHRKVSVANALGSGWANTPALAPFMPGLARFFLGEDLGLPDAPSFWCGDSHQRRQALTELDQMVVRPTFRRRQDKPLFTAHLEEAELDRLRARIEANPSDFVAQKQLSLSTAPVWKEGRFAPRHLVLRVFVISFGNRHQVLPGGLVRMSPDSESLVVSPTGGGRAKDAWVLAPDPSFPPDFNSAEYAPIRAPFRLSRAGTGLPSRVADNLFWLGRYAERVESLARLRRIGLVRRLENARAEELDVLTGSADHLSELLSSLSHLRRLCAQVRDRLSQDSWSTLHQLSLEYEGPGVESQQELASLLAGLAAFWGMLTETMSRSHEWRFLKIGKRLERSLRVLSLLSRTLGTRQPSEPRLLEAILEMLDGARAYRQKYPGGVIAEAVVDQILVDESNPRSVAFQLESLENHFARLPQEGDRAWSSAEAKLLLGCQTDIRLADINLLCQVAPGSQRVHLLELCNGLRARLLQMSEAISRSYLTHLDPSRQ